MNAQIYTDGQGKEILRVDGRHIANITNDGKGKWFLYSVIYVDGVETVKNDNRYEVTHIKNKKEAAQEYLNILSKEDNRCLNY